MLNCPVCGAPDPFYDPETYEYCCDLCKSRWDSEPESSLVNVSTDVPIDRQIIDLFLSLDLATQREVLKSIVAALQQEQAKHALEPIE